MRSDLARTAIIALLIVAGGCGTDVPVTEPQLLQTGYWQVRIDLPGGHIDTAFEIGGTNEGYRATLINGQERIRIGEVSYSDGRLLLRFPAFNNEINARLEDGKLVGSLTLVKRFGETQTMPFVAVPGAQLDDLDSDEPATVDMSGRWEVEFHKEDGTSNPSVGEFAQRGSRLFGTFLTPTADHRYLSGYVSGNDFHLGTFDGAHAYIFTGTVQDGLISHANFWSGTEFHQTWSAERDPNAVLPDAYQMTYLKPGYDRFEFEFPNQDGHQISLSDERFEGKVVIVVIAGTWCPNCHDETRFLSELYEEFSGVGLEVVGLMYEHFDDHVIASRQIRKYREKFNIQFETLVAGISDKTAVSETLPSLSTILAFPTTIFVDRNAAVRVIHTGFSGPGTGKHHEKLKEQFKRLIVELIDETVDAEDAAERGI